MILNCEIASAFDVIAPPPIRTTGPMISSNGGIIHNQLSRSNHNPASIRMTDEPPDRLRL